MNWLLILNNNGFVAQGHSCGCQGNNQYHRFANGSTEVKVYKKLNQYQIKKDNVWSDKKAITELSTEF
jgi:hypothetical protein